MKGLKLLIVLQFILFSLIYGQEKTQVIYSGNVKQANEVSQLLKKGIHHFEMDVMPIYGELYVTGSMPDSANHTKPTFNQAYLLPIYMQFQKNGNAILPRVNHESFIILNLAFDPSKVYQILRSELGPMHDMLTYKSDGEWHKGNLQLLVKDETLKAKINQNNRVLVGVIGEKSDIDNGFNAKVMPIIELDFSELTSWNGFGNIPFEDYLSIKNMVAKVHENEKKLCIADCPKSEDAWEVLTKAKVDFISTIYAGELQDFINSKTVKE